MATAETVSGIAVHATGLELIYQRRAVRAYRPGAVGEADIRALLDAAVHAPTAMHQEPWKFVVIQNRSMLRRLSNRAKAMAVAQAFGARQPAPSDDGAQTRRRDHLDSLTSNRRRK